jgi:acyl carrier protein
MDKARKIRGFILENYLFTDDESALQNDQSLLEAGIIDSTGVLELIAFIEETFELEVEDDDMVPENFDSVERITEYLTRKTKG